MQGILTRTTNNIPGNILFGRQFARWRAGGDDPATDGEAPRPAGYHGSEKGSKQSTY